MSTTPIAMKSYLRGEWHQGAGASTELLSAIDGQPIANFKEQTISFDEILNYGKSKAGPILRKMTFRERGAALKKIALLLMEHKEEFYKLSYFTGATRIDSWIDIEGGIGTLFAYASKSKREFPDLPHYVDGKVEPLSKGGTFVGHHVCVPLEGVGLHINAFNFPIWGMLEKFAVTFLAGVPSVVKPASVSGFLAHAVVDKIIKSQILPEGSLQLFFGRSKTMFDSLTYQDVVTFTGSAETGNQLRLRPNIVNNSIRFNLEADSLNCSILGPDIQDGSEEIDIFIKEVVREMTAKAGQKCTAIRRIFVPASKINLVADKLKARLEKLVIGDPRLEQVKMGALASVGQKADVQSKINILKQSCEIFYQGKEQFLGDNTNKGSFLTPHLLLAKNLSDLAPHTIEAFGPVSTLIPYQNQNDLFQFVRLGGGSLVGSVVTCDSHFAMDLLYAAGPHHGRLLFLDRTSAKESTGHGSPMPQLVHGGPGRAGGGEELGGVRGVLHYMQRLAIQGSPTMVGNLTGQFIKGGHIIESEIHPFKKKFNELTIGQTITTHKRTITESDIVQFGNLSWDHFYAHTDDTSVGAPGDLFEKRVAHGYFILAAAAGLFVEPKKGPVLANYGLDEFRFIKPVYVGTTIAVRLTVKEKLVQEKRPDDHKAKGVVKWLVDVFDQTGETVAIGTILTLVERSE